MLNIPNCRVLDAGAYKSHEMDNVARESDFHAANVFAKMTMPINMLNWVDSIRALNIKRFSLHSALSTFDLCRY